MNLIVPLLILFMSCYALFRRVDVFDALLTGGRDGLMTVVRIIPALVALLTAISMLRASGALDEAARLCAPVFNLFGIPPECAPLVLLRPLSGSGGLALGAELIHTYGVDSDIGRAAAVMLGSSETTFYTISVTCGAAGVSKTKYALPAALIADFVGFLAASWAVRLFF